MQNKAHAPKGSLGMRPPPHCPHRWSEARRESAVPVFADAMYAAYVGDRTVTPGPSVGGNGPDRT